MTYSIVGSLLGALAGAVVFSGCTSPPASAPPKLVFQGTTHDFGRPTQGTKVMHTYAFHNAGGLDLTIDNIRAACDCTVAALSRRVIPPGGEGSIEATLDTSHDIGRQTRTITVYSNDPAQPVTTLSLVGDITAEAAADPPALYVGHVHRGQVASNEVRLLAGDSVAVGPPESHGTVVDASLRTAATGPRIRVAIKPNAPPGRFKDTVTVRTSSARQPLLTIPVVGVVDVDAAERRE